LGEGGVETAIGVETDDLMSPADARCGEVTADEDLPVALHHHAINAAERIDAGIEGRRAFDAAIGVETRDPAARHSIHTREVSTEKNLPVGLQRYTPNISLDAGSRIEGSRILEAAIGIEPGDAGARGSVHLREATGEENAPVGLYRHACDLTIHTRGEAPIDAAVSMQPNHMDSTRVPVPSDNDLPIRLHCRDGDVAEGDTRIEAQVGHSRRLRPQRGCREEE
jgi:hypothetical protein